MSRTILPGATLGMGGVGLDECLQSRQALGYRVHVFLRRIHPPAGSRFEVGNYDDFDAVAAFAQDADVVSY